MTGNFFENIAEGIIRCMIFGQNFLFFRPVCSIYILDFFLYFVLLLFVAAAYLPQNNDHENVKDQVAHIVEGHKPGQLQAKVYDVPDIDSVEGHQRGYE